MSTFYRRVTALEFDKLGLLDLGTCLLANIGLEFVEFELKAALTKDPANARTYEAGLRMVSVLRAIESGSMLHIVGTNLHDSAS